jgi:7,8-dihydropterin-6-yl-methyl-4-(beta-D-ribofuranosyl)aminobenzene 5'-phosphate synthase
MPRLAVTVLVDNTTLIDRYFTAEPGLSFCIETSGKKILFDLGYSGIFLANAKKLGIDLLDLDYVVLSHGHIDHTGGLVPLMHHFMEATIEHHSYKLPMVIAHPHCFYPRPMPPLADIGAPFDDAQLRRHFPVILSTSPVWLTDDLVYLGEIPQDNGRIVSKKRIIITPEGNCPDLLLDDTALAFKSDQGLVIITGCSHTGICAIIRYARQVCGEQRIRDVIGGYHLMDDDSAGISMTVNELAALEPAALHPCHCTSLAAKIALAQVAPLHEVGVGLKLEY